MKYSKILFTLVFALCCAVTLLPYSVQAGLFGNKTLTFDEAREKLEPHKAIYNISLVATRSGSSVVNISGKMFYEWRPSCDGWITDHRFNLFYEYADGPGMQVKSDFSTFEAYDGESFNFTAQRKRNDTTYEQYLGQATMGDDRMAIYTMPEDLQHELSKGTNFPMRHTVKLIQKAFNNDKFFSAPVFDGSDEEGPVEINAFIGDKATADKVLLSSKAISGDLLKTTAWNVRMAVFPENDDGATSDYEMSIVFHENGVISDMLVDYDDFSVKQELVALEKLDHNKCE